jgi:hypothetical protein
MVVLRADRFAQADPPTRNANLSGRDEINRAPRGAHGTPSISWAGASDRFTGWPYAEVSPWLENETSS